MRLLALPLLLALGLNGCVSVGVKCGSKYESKEAWAKLTRFGLGIPAKQIAVLARFKQEVCP